ncbi:MAG: regulatory iron-sulfur-containing complex subunit RicT [Humidesulfovibrio sp.]|nr:regulatory iron-sulfur-containing complex subunit RicT [Humidesulfovibrio sp.]
MLGSADWEHGSPDAATPDAETAGAASAHGGASSPEQPQAGDAVPGGVYSLEQGAQYQPRPKSVAGLQTIYRLAGPADLETGAENRHLGRRAFNFCRGCIFQQDLEMKLVDVEVLHDRSKMIFFFTAPNRIDFRELIKCLVREFHTRIELRQIGVRHETQMIGAIGNCGQVCCCRRFLRKFAPVTIKMAKEQNLFLNPAKISGICGRLLCCLSYEQKGYEEFHKQCPKMGKRFQTAIGNVKVLRGNFFKKSISVWVEEVGEREYTLDEWKELMNRQVSPEGAAPAPEAQPSERQEGRQEGRPVQGRQGAGRQAQGRQGESRPSTGRPARPERAPRPERSEHPDRPERSDKPEQSDRPGRPEPKAQAAEAHEAAPQGAAAAVAAPRAEASPEARALAGGEAEPGRSRPRRKRRKGRGPKPA